MKLAGDERVVDDVGDCGNENERMNIPSEAR